MQNLFWLAKVSGKQIFKNLKSQSPFYSKVLDANIQITKVFYNHIVYNSKKKRPQKEIIKRILIIPFIPLILKEGEIITQREKKDKLYLQITYNKQQHRFTIIILKENNIYSLLSCFLEDSKKKDLPTASML